MNLTKADKQLRNEKFTAVQKATIETCVQINRMNVSLKQKKNHFFCFPSEEKKLL